MRRARRLLLLAFALSLLVHLIVAVVLHPAAPGPPSEPEVVSIEHRATIAVTKPATPPPHPPPTPLPSPRVQTSAPPKGRAPGRVRSGPGRQAAATAAPVPVATPRPTPASGNKCDRPNAAAAVVASPAPPDIAPGARAEGTSGVAVISVQLDPSGAVTGAGVQQSTGNSSLDLVAVEMARDARYSPALRDCKPVATTYPFSVKFVAW
ncbi:MAG: TonB family protein [Candidatus Eremiobacteraeota bacterium]|nr:TonB family protein [Candidatus Eremiobacteraeota bacterium]